MDAAEMIRRLKEVQSALTDVSSDLDIDSPRLVASADAWAEGLAQALDPVITALGDVSDVCECDPGARVYCHATTCKGGENVRCDECAESDNDPMPWCECRIDQQCKGPCRSRAHDPAHCPGPWTDTNWGHITVGDEVQGGDWYAWTVDTIETAPKMRVTVSRGVVIATGQPLKSFTFTPSPGMPVKARRRDMALDSAFKSLGGAFDVSLVRGETQP